jgi:hypothetical protein
VVEELDELHAASPNVLETTIAASHARCLLMSITLSVVAENRSLPREIHALI